MNDTMYCDYVNDTVYCNGACKDCGNSTQTFYTYEIENISDEYTADEVMRVYRDLDDCIDDAKNDLMYYADSDKLYQATIYEETHKLGDIIGEPTDIYTMSNLNETDTKAIRQAKGYCRADVDEYLQQ